MRTETITCDACERDLTSTGNGIDWRLALLNQAIPSRPGPVTDLAIRRRIPRDAYFCGIACLKKWIGAQ